MKVQLLLSHQLPQTETSSRLLHPNPQPQSSLTLKMGYPQYFNKWRFETNLGTSVEEALEGLCCLLCVQSGVKYNCGSADALIAHCSSCHNYLQFEYKRGLVTVLYVKRTKGTITVRMQPGTVGKNRFEWRNVFGAHNLSSLHGRLRVGILTVH